MRETQHRLGVLGIAVLIYILLAAPSGAAEVVQVKISDLAFLPADVTAKVGDTIEWTNGDFVDHTATAKDGTWDLAIPAGKTAHLRLAMPGTIAYYCKIHPNMTGTIHVDPK
jgi:plastocyanin